MISAVVLTKNEEKNIARCLESLAWCDEIVVVDDNSIDNTVKIANRFDVKVLRRKLNNNFSAQRNFALQNTNHDWVFFVDADEVVSRALALEIKTKIKNKKYLAYYITRRDVFLGKFMTGGQWSNQKIVRLAYKKNTKWEREVHETWNVNESNIGIINEPLMHYPYENLNEFLEKVNFYSTIHAKSNARAGKRVNIAKICLFPIIKFLYLFFVKRGFKDGTFGFVYSVLMSFHSYLAWSKQWEKQ